MPPIANRITKSISRRLTQSSRRPTNLFQVRGFSDTNYFVSPAGAGLSQLGTVRLVAKVLSVPTAGQKVLLGRFEGAATRGWYLNTGLMGDGDFGVVVGTVAGVSTASFGVLVAGDVGKVFVAHATAANGSFLKAYLGGILSNQDAVVTLDNAAAGDEFRVGNYQYAGGLGCPHFGIIDICTSSTVMTAQQIYEDAKTIQSRQTGYIIPSLPSTVDRFNADTLANSTNWLSRTSNLSLTRTGSLTVEKY